MQNKNILIVIIVVAVVALSLYLFLMESEPDTMTVDETVLVVPTEESTNPQAQEEVSEPQEEIVIKEDAVRLELSVIDEIIGMDVDAASEYIEENDGAIRVVFEDGVPLETTADYQPGRINAEVSGGVVTGYFIE
jgi:hypothetical protein